MPFPENINHICGQLARRLREMREGEAAMLERIKAFPPEEQEIVKQSYKRGVAYNESKLRALREQPR